jgi:hypothetical protein
MEGNGGRFDNFGGIEITGKAEGISGEDLKGIRER